MHAWLLLFALPLAADPAPGVQLAYQGKLGPTQSQRDATEQAEPAARKQFDLSCWVRSSDAGSDIYWLLDEQGRGQWPWIERFGLAQLDHQGHASGDSPALLYDRPESKAPPGAGPASQTPAGKDAVPLLLPLVRADKPLAVGVEWQIGRLAMHVEREEKRGERRVWRIALADQFGRKGTAWVDTERSNLVALEQRVILGRGDEYSLKLELVGSEQLPAEQLDRSVRAFDVLLALRNNLAVPSRAPEIDWKPEQLALLKKSLPDVKQAVAGTPLEKLIAAATRDLDLQSGRSSAVAALASEYQGKTIEPFTIRGPADEVLTDRDLADHVTVLHFWEYRDEPLKEPYGQVGYVDFISHRRKDAGVRVYGVAVDGRLGDEKTRPAALRSVRKLKEFMNLSYPVLLDDGALLKKFGDPRVLGATLPLFVVIGRGGRIAHYHVGYYDVHQDQGLKELDEAISAALEAK